MPFLIIGGWCFYFHSSLPSFVICLWHSSWEHFINICTKSSWSSEHCMNSLLLPMSYPHARKFAAMIKNIQAQTSDLYTCTNSSICMPKRSKMLKCSLLMFINTSFIHMYINAVLFTSLRWCQVSTCNYHFHTSNQEKPYIRVELLWALHLSMHYLTIIR